MVREHVKWEYELRHGQPINTLVGRAVDIAMSEPKGPVYLQLPRELLGSPSTNPGPLPRGRAFGTVPAIPDIDALERAADMIAAAENPVIVMTTPANAATFKALGAFAEAHAIAVLTGPHAALSSSNPMNLGRVNGPALKAADLILVLNSPVPWVPKHMQPNKDARLIHIAPDPLFTTYPFRGFEMDLAIAGDPAAALTMLGDMLNIKLKGREAATDRRRKLNGEKRQALLDSRRAAIEAASTQRPISYVWAAHCVNEVKGANTTIVEEIGVPFDFLDIEDDRDFMATSLGSGSLGMALGMGLGAKFAAPDRTVITTCGRRRLHVRLPDGGPFRQPGAKTARPHHDHEQFTSGTPCARLSCPCTRTGSPPRPTACRSSTFRPRPTTTRSQRPSAATARRWTTQPSSRGPSAAPSNRSRRDGRRL